MTPDIDEAWSELDAGSPALVRMRRYTTWIMVAVVAFYMVLISMAQSRSVPVLAVSLAIGALVCWQCVYWEKGARPAIAVPALVASYVLLWVVAVSHRNPMDGVAFYMSAALATSVPPFTRWRWNGLAIALAVIPVAVLDDVKALVGVAVMAATAIAVVRGNSCAFGLYLEIDHARRDTAELAVMRERYRFAADLHDIQGQALHVSRLKLQLADKLLDRDPELARTHVREAEQLIAETIAETRGLAYGERSITLAGELANSQSLVLAAGVELEVRGTAPIGHPLDELFALVVRETTTNLLRHAHAAHVVVDLGPDFVRIVNDGVTEKTQALSGLARLGSRFAAVGGTLETRREGTTFTTTALAASMAEISAPHISAPEMSAPEMSAPGTSSETASTSAASVHDRFGPTP